MMQIRLIKEPYSSMIKEKFIRIEADNTNIYKQFASSRNLFILLKNVIVGFDTARSLTRDLAFKRLDSYPRPKAWARSLF